MGLRQRRVVEFDLHIDDMSDAHARQLRHVFFVPNAAADSNPAGDPRNVHPQGPYSPVQD